MRTQPTKKLFKLLDIFALLSGAFLVACEKQEIGYFGADPSRYFDSENVYTHTMFKTMFFGNDKCSYEVIPESSFKENPTPTSSFTSTGDPKSVNRFRNYELFYCDVWYNKENKKWENISTFEIINKNAAKKYLISIGYSGSDLNGYGLCLLTIYYKNKLYINMADDRTANWAYDNCYFGSYPLEYFYHSDSFKPHPPKFLRFELCKNFNDLCKYASE